MSFVRQVSSSRKRKLTEKERKDAKDLLEKARSEDSRLVKGVFKNLECPGGDLQFAYGYYKEEGTSVYHFLDGKEYEIPLGVAKHINRQCKYKKSRHLIDKDGNPMIGAGKPVERYQFVSTDFM